MRKLTSILLVLVLVLTCGLSVSANMSEEQFVDFVSAMNFFESDGYESSALMTRAQFADFIAKVLGVSSDSAEGNFKALYSMGAMDCERNGDFHADADITYNEAAKAMLVIAGYGEAARVGGGYNAYAAKYGITCGKSGNSALSVGNVMELLYRTLNLNTMECTYGETPKYSLNTDKTVLQEILDVEESRGILSACGKTDLYSVKEAADDRIVVGGTEYVGDADLYREYIGYKVSVLYREKADEKEIVFLYPEKRNDVVVLKTEDILDYKNKAYEYDEDGRTESYSVENAVFLYNGKLPTDAKFEFVPVNGWVELIDNNGDGDYDVVKIYSYKNYYVELTQDDADGLLIYSKERENVLVVSESNHLEDTVLMKEDGSDLKLKGLKKGGLVSVFGTVSDGILVAERLYYSTNAAEGVVDSYDAGEEVISVNGKEYSFTADLKAETESIAVGSYRTFIVDFNGKLAYLYNEDGFEYNQGIGYLVAMDTASGPFEDRMDVKIFTSAGRMEIYSSTDKIYIDGTLYKGSDTVIKNLKAATQSGLVAYTLNNDKTLRSIDYPENKRYGDTSPQDPLNHMVSLGGTSSSVKYRTSHNTFGGNIPCHDNTIMFILPNNPTSAENEDFSISNPKTYCRDDGTFANIYGYAYSNSSMCADFIVYTEQDKTTTSLTVNDYDFAYVVKSVKKVLSSDGETVMAVEAVGPNGTETFELKTDSAFSGYEVGDVVRFATDIRGKAVSLQSVYDRSAKTFNDSLDSASINCAFRAMTGRLFDRQNDNVLVAKEGKDLAQTSIALTYDSFNALKCDTAKIVLVKKDSGGKATVKSGSKDDLKAYTTHMEDCSTVVATTRVGVCNLIVVFE